MISSCNAARDRKTANVEASNADNTAVAGNSRKVRNSHCISQIPIYEKHSLEIPIDRLYDALRDLGPRVVQIDSTRRA